MYKVIFFFEYQKTKAILDSDESSAIRGDVSADISAVYS